MGVKMLLRLDFGQLGAASKTFESPILAFNIYCGIFLVFTTGVGNVFVNFE